MRPFLHASLVNGRTGDPALYVETLFEKRTLLFDLGDITRLSPRKIHRVDQIFVSHAHIDHLVGFDHLLRLLVGRDKTVNLYGPEGFIEHIRHKLLAYRWNLVDRYPCDLVFRVTELAGADSVTTARFRLKSAFTQEATASAAIVDGVLHSEPGYRVRAALLDHGTPCLGFVMEEAIHINVWKRRLGEMGLAVGPWLRELKRAVADGWPDDHPIRINGPEDGRTLPLRALRHLVTVTRGQKIGYVTDVSDTPENRRAIIDLARCADLLFIEAAFAQADEQLAQERAHLTTKAAGEIARAAQAQRIEPFHFSPRYAGEEARMLDEVQAAFANRAAGPGTAG
jgi:ribonuclease Z